MRRRCNGALLACRTVITLFFVAAFLSFVVSAAAGMGGSLILVPSLVLIFGGKPGIVLSAILLASNNVFKLVFYRRSIPFLASALLVATTIIGSLLGARVLVAAPKAAVDIGVAVALVATFCFELGGRRRLGDDRAAHSQVLKGASPLLAFLAGATSGFSGTSGPLKGIAIRSLGFDRFHLVGAASMISLCGDVTKSVVFAGEGLYSGRTLALVAAALPLMFLGTYLGRRFNRQMGEQLYAVTFWTVMAGYGIRLAIV
jgi:uncharacterized membrane protein YfcA